MSASYRRILCLSPTGGFGGAERSLFNVIVGLREAKPEWTIALIVGSDGELVSRVRALGVDVIVLPFPRSLARFGETAWLGVSRRWLPLRPAWHLATALCGASAYVVRLRAALRSQRPDLIHTNGLKMHLLAVLAKRPHSRLVWHMHDYIGRRPLTAWLLRRCQGGCTRVLANSLSVRDDLVRSGIAPSRVDVLYNAVDLNEFTPHGPVADLDRMANLQVASSPPVRIGLVGTFARWKGHDVFLRAIAKLVRHAQPVRAYVIGDAVYDTQGSQYSLAELKGLAGDLALEPVVGFTGFVDDLAPVYRALDIVTHTSVEPEPFGLVVAEAMACGRAVVASNAGGTAEVIEPGVTALGCAPGNVDELARLLTGLVGDIEARARLGAAAHTASSRYGRHVIVQRLVSLYERAMTAEVMDGSVARRATNARA